MLLLRLTRLLGTRSYTEGMLSEETTGFRCATLERAHPDYVGGMKNFLALPNGMYKLRLQMPDLTWTLGISATGVYRRAAFLEGKEAGGAAGSVVVGKRTKRGKMEGSEEVQLIIHELLETAIGRGDIQFCAKRLGDIILTIRDDPAFVFLNEEKREEPKVNINWNMYEEDEDDDEL